MKLFTTYSEIGWKANAELIIYIVNLDHDSTEIGRSFCWIMIFAELVYRIMKLSMHFYEFILLKE